MTKNTNRQRGDYLERQARDALRAHQWVVVRAAGSHGPADLVALRAGRTPLLIACKVDGTIGPGERRALVDAADMGGARPMLASRERRGYVDLYDVAADRVTGPVDQIKVPARPSSEDEPDE